MKKKQRREIMQLKITSQKFCKMQEVLKGSPYFLLGKLITYLFYLFWIVT